MWFRRRVGREPFLLFFDVVCYVVRTSFGRRLARRGFKNRKPIGDGRAKPLMDREQQSEKSQQSKKSQRTEAASISQPQKHER